MFPSPDTFSRSVSGTDRDALVDDLDFPSLPSSPPESVGGEWSLYVTAVLLNLHSIISTADADVDVESIADEEATG